MSKEGLKLLIVTPEGVIFDEKILSATFPGIDGEFGVYPDHCSLLSLLSSGVIELVDMQQRKEYVAIDWGYIKVEKNCIDVLANGAVAISKEGKISESIQRAKDLLKRASSDDMLIGGALSRLDYLSGR